MKTPTREYMAHKAEYDATYYASHIKGDPDTYEIIYVNPETEHVRRHVYQCTTITLYIRCRLRELFPIYTFVPD